MELDAWLAPFRRFWSTHVDALVRHLDRMKQETRIPTRRQATAGFQRSGAVRTPMPNSPCA
jgi:hypothetical protein